MATNNPHLPTDKGIILKGVAWTTGYRVFATFAQFGAMLVLVRIIPPEEYGRAGAVVGVLTMLNVLSCRAFFSQALQLPKGEEPDWTMHWRAGLWLQATLFVVTNAIAGGLWFVPSHRSIATLLHLASLGILIECPSSLRSTMLQRALDFPRLRILDGISKTFSILTMLSLGVAGFGALAIVAGANVIPAIPGAIDLLLVHRFRPRSGWFKFLDWRRYKASLLFGFQQSWSGLLQSLRGALEAAVLPLQLGFAALGLLQRAQSLFLATVGQVNSIFAETVYPLLPKHAAEPERYRNTATLFLQVVFWIVLPGAVFVAWQGKAALRVLYGERWIAADPLIAPGAVIGAAVCLFGAGYNILLAKTDLKRCVLLDVTVALATAPLILTVMLGGDMVTYAWALGAGQLTAAVAAIGMATRWLQPGWPRTVLAPPLVGATVAVLALHATLGLESLPLIVQLLCRGSLYLCIMALVIRVLFPSVLVATMQGVPGGHVSVGGFGCLRGKPPSKCSARLWLP